MPSRAMLSLRLLMGCLLSKAMAGTRRSRDTALRPRRPQPPLRPTAPLAKRSARQQERRSEAAPRVLSRPAPSAPRPEPATQQPRLQLLTARPRRPMAAISSPPTACRRSRATAAIRRVSRRACVRLGGFQRMERVALAAMLALVGLALSPPAHAVVCGAGVLRAGCVGPNGAAVVRRPVPVPRPAVVARPGAVRCAAGVYRAGCVGPNGAVVRKRY